MQSCRDAACGGGRRADAQPPQQRSPVELIACPVLRFVRCFDSRLLAERALKSFAVALGHTGLERGSDTGLLLALECFLAKEREPCRQCRGWEYGGLL